MLLSYLLGLEAGKSSERDRLEAEARKRREEELTALKEQYILGLLMPVRGQETFKVVVREPSKFDFSIVKELLRHIESPVKYFKYYEEGGVQLQEGYSTGGEDYRSYKRTEVLQNTFALFLFVSVFLSAYLLQTFALNLQNPVWLFVYWWVSLGLSVISGVVPMLIFTQKDETIVGYGRL